MSNEAANGVHSLLIQPLFWTKEGHLFKHAPQKIFNYAVGLQDGDSSPDFGDALLAALGTTVEDEDRTVS